jgi:hypothetical protein
MAESGIQKERYSNGRAVQEQLAEAESEERGRG